MTNIVSLSLYLSFFVTFSQGRLGQQEDGPGSMLRWTANPMLVPCLPSLPLLQVCVCVLQDIWKDFFYFILFYNIGIFIFGFFSVVLIITLTNTLYTLLFTFIIHFFHSPILILFLDSYSQQVLTQYHIYMTQKLFLFLILSIHFHPSFYLYVYFLILNCLSLSITFFLFLFLSLSEVYASSLFSAFIPSSIASSLILSGVIHFSNFCLPILLTLCLSILLTFHLLIIMIFYFLFYQLFSTYSSNILSSHFSSFLGTVKTAFFTVCRFERMKNGKTKCYQNRQKKVGKKGNKESL